VSGCHIHYTFSDLVAALSSGDAVGDDYVVVASVVESAAAVGVDADSL